MFIYVLCTEFRYCCTIYIVYRSPAYVFAVKMLISNIYFLPSIFQYYFCSRYVHHQRGGAYKYICCAELVRVLSVQCDESTCVVLAWDRVVNNDYIT
jgi:hypothetical protein